MNPIAILCWILSFLAVERLAELALSRVHARKMAALGGFEAGRSQYPWIVALHAGFLISLCAEALLSPAVSGSRPNPAPLAVFACAEALRLWAMASLGVFWNTRIWVLPGHTPVRRGPYRWLRHPNYLAVTVQLAALPIAFHAYATAVVFSILNYRILVRRIRTEEAALQSATGYAVQFERVPRGFLWRVR